MYYSSLVSYDKTLKTYKDLNDDKIGIIEDVNDIEGYVLPKERKKWFHVGPCIGIGIGTDGKVRPYAGVSCILSLMSW